MRIVCISDSHGLIPTNNIPEGDVLIHAGDCTNQGYIEEIKNFLDWFDSIKGFKNKIFIAGNHDWGFQEKPEECKLLLENYPNITYLQDSEVIIDDLKFYGSPWQPEFFSWAFNLKRGKEIEAKWKLIPDDVNVLITHGPPYGIGDFVPYGGGENVGCEDLLDRVHNLEKLKLHVFGHIHYSYGEYIRNNVNFVNAALCTEQYRCINKPIVIEL